MMFVRQRAEYEVRSSDWGADVGSSVLRGLRRASWLTGVPLLVFVYISAMGGFWLGWDRLGQYAAVASAELLDELPLLTAALTRNFVNVDAVSDRLFSLLVFIHLGVPLLMLFGLWLARKSVVLGKGGSLRVVSGGW